MEYTISYFEQGKNEGNDFSSMFFRLEGKTILEMRVSGTALCTSDSGLVGIDIEKWLYETGLDVIDKLKPKEKIIVQCTDYDVKDGKVIKPYDTLLAER